METIKKCIIQKYDPMVKNPPFKFITVGTCTIVEPSVKDNGVTRCRLFHAACKNLNLQFRFWSIPENKEYDYSLTVRGELENALNI